MSVVPLKSALWESIQLFHLENPWPSPLLESSKRPEQSVMPHYIFFQEHKTCTFFFKKRRSHNTYCSIPWLFSFTTVPQKYGHTDLVGHMCRLRGQGEEALAQPPRAYSQATQHVTGSLHSPTLWEMEYHRGSPCALQKPIWVSQPKCW